MTNTSEKVSRIKQVQMIPNQVQQGIIGSNYQCNNILPVIQIEVREGLLKIRAFCSSLHLQFTQTPAILDTSLLSSFIHLTDTTNLDNCIKLQWHFCFIYPLVKETEIDQTKSYSNVLLAKLGQIHLSMKGKNKIIHSLWKIV